MPCKFWLFKIIFQALLKRCKCHSRKDMIRRSLEGTSLFARCLLTAVCSHEAITTVLLLYGESIDCDLSALCSHYLQFEPTGTALAARRSGQGVKGKAVSPPPR